MTLMTIIKLLDNCILCLNGYLQAYDTTFSTSKNISVNYYYSCSFVVYRDESGPTGVLKQGTPLGLRFLKACSISLLSEEGSILQNEPLPGSSWERATLMKYRFRDRLWRIEFYNTQKCNAAFEVNTVLMEIRFSQLFIWNCAVNLILSYSSSSTE